MSLYDVSKLSGASPVRATGRDYANSKAEAKPARTEKALDKGVSVESGSRVSAGQVPVDNDRVHQIRQALRDGSYPIVPTQIADAIIAARHMLSDSQ